MRFTALSLVVALLFLLCSKQAESGCPFQNPFWFVEKPLVVPVTDENNQVLPNRVRVMWGRMENFKCVDYFQVEYFQQLNPSTTVQMTPRINRHRRSVEIEVAPCTEYYFKVIASEDWKGMREDFKMFSEVVASKLDYTPKFLVAPQVKERRRTTPEQDRTDRRAQLRAQRKKEQQQPYDPYGSMVADDAVEAPPAGDPAEAFLVKVAWRLTDLDYPNCLDYFVLDYYDTLDNETGFSRTFARPFHSPKFEMEVANGLVPCEQDYEFLVRAVGLNGQFSTANWTPPSCVVTTLAPETTTVTEEAPEEVEPEETTEDVSAQMEEVQRENERLQAKIDGLKQEYEKIGFQVFHAFRESFFQGLEDFLVRRKVQDKETTANGVQAVSETEESDSLFG